MELAEQFERGLDLLGCSAAHERELLEEDVLSSASSGPSAGALPAEQEMAEEDREDEIAESSHSTCPTYAVLLEVMERTAGRLRLPWQHVRREIERGRLDDRFLSGHKLQTLVSHPFFPNLRTEVEKAWKIPYSRRIHQNHCANFSDVEGLAEHGDVSVPPIDETFANYLLSGNGPPFPEGGAQILFLSCLESLCLSDCSITEKQCVILTSALKSNPSHLRELNLSWNKLGDSGVKNLNDLLMNPEFKLEKLSLSSPPVCMQLNICSITEKQCVILTSALKSNPSHLRELILSGNKLGVKNLSDLLMNPQFKLEKLDLYECSITEKQCVILTSALKSNPSHLRELDLSENKIENTGVKHLCDVLMDSHCKLERLRLSNCSVTEEGYKALASALSSNPSHLIELDLTGNDPGQSGVKKLSDLLHDPNCQLKTLRFLSAAADEACQYVKRVVGKNPLLQRELNLSEHELGDTGVNQIAALLQDKYCQLNKLMCKAQTGCRTETEDVRHTASRKTPRLGVLSTAAEKEPSVQTPADTGCGDPLRCKAQTGRRTETEDVRHTASRKTPRLGVLSTAAEKALKSNPSHLRELDLSWNELGDSGVKNLSDLLMNPQFKLEKLSLSSPPVFMHRSGCSITEEQCVILTSALKSNPSHLRELILSRNNLGVSGVKNLSDLLINSQFKLEKLDLSRCSITEKQCVILTSALKSNPSHLRELNLSENKIGNTGVKHLCDVLKDSHCKLERLRLSNCSVTEEGYKALASALRSNPSHLIELDLTGNYPGQSGVKELSDLLQDPNCQLKTLRFLSAAADEACQYVERVVGKNLLLQRELKLSEHELGDTRVNQIAALLQDKHCRLNTLILSECIISEKQCVILTSALKSNPSHLRELDLSWNELGDSGVKNLSDLLMNPQFKLEKLDLSECSITEGQCVILTSALKSNPSHLRELNLSGNKLRDSGVKNLSDLLMNLQFKLEKLHLSECRITEKQFVILTSALKSNPSHLRGLDLSENKIGNTGVKHLCDVLKDLHCKLERLSLYNCGITDVSSLTQSLTNSKALQFLKDLDLSFNMIGDSKQQLRDVLRDSKCDLR
ncbi:Ribonuclease inhibitor [Anabarilius grahami]|uniref:Ribonuclease inhibitor n=1 Tax=Anabarilius grahami TaxID=495550 RepID=A0A3N0XU37_ANAGA|nr:Ribonuclease inhibitor [Anabarilius grahami]